jgi:hypothetical protein
MWCQTANLDACLLAKSERPIKCTSVKVIGMNAQGLFSKPMSMKQANKHIDAMKSLLLSGHIKLKLH